MPFLHVNLAMTNHVLSKTSKKNTKKLQMLKQNVKQLCKDVVIPLYNAGKDMELPSELKDGIDIFIQYA